MAVKNALICLGGGRRLSLTPRCRGNQSAALSIPIGSAVYCAAPRMKAFCWSG